jgi:signal transduction histidine kinase
VPRIAFLVVGALIAYQLAITLLHPPWISPVTDWVRAALAWPELAVAVFVSVWLTRAHQPAALSWWFLSVAMLSYTIARNLWTVYDRFIYPNHVPFPTFPDLFFILQYPFFLLAIFVLPGNPPWDLRLKAVLDCLLLMAAASALSWYFVLAPLYLMSGESQVGKFVNLIYTVGDLGMVFGLIVALIYRQSSLTRSVLVLLIGAFICLVLADTWAASILLYPSHVYRTGNPPDMFWNAFYLLVALAGLVQVRLTQQVMAAQRALPVEAPERPSFQRDDFKEAFRVFAPLGAALVACAVIAVRAIIAPLVRVQPLIPILIIFGLLLLVLVRQGITMLEIAQLRRRWVVAQANEQSLYEINRRMEAFLGIAGHELKTPLTTVILSLQRLLRRAQQRVSPPQEGVGRDRKMEVSLGDLELPLQQAGRLNRLVNELLDTSRIQAGQLKLDLKPGNVVAIVHAAVEEQRQAHPERPIILSLPEGPMPVVADADRIGQVVTNYLTNALKYSPEDRPVEVGVQMEGQHGRVWVRDQGMGIPQAEQKHIWERFRRVPGIEIQSGSGIGLGLGLHISKTIIELHGGQVGVQSTPGQGSRFWFTLPLAVPEQGGEA